jgi:predicted DNA-binding transcriptional regulator AlpA
MSDRLHDVIRELAQEIAKEMAKVLKAEKSEALAPIQPVVLPRLTPSRSKYLTQRDLATLFNVSSRTIYNWRTQDKLPAVRLLPNGRKVWREDEIEAWIATAQNRKKRITDHPHGVAESR